MTPKATETRYAYARGVLRSYLAEARRRLTSVETHMYNAGERHSRAVCFSVQQRRTLSNQVASLAAALEALR